MENYCTWTDDPDLLGAVTDTFLFRGKTAEEILALVGKLPVTRFAKRANMSSAQLGILLEGEAEVFCIHSGSRVLLTRLGVSDSFGAALLFGEPDSGVPAFPTEIRAISVCTVLFIEPGALEEMLRGDFVLAGNYIAFLSGRIRFLNRRIAGFTVGTANSRLAAYLSEHADIDGNVTLPRSMTALASALDIGRSSLYRSLDALSEAGAITRSEGTLRITNGKALREWGALP